MSCQLTVRARDGVRQWEQDEWTVLVVLAALSAEPETVGELAEAVRRYQPEHWLLEAGQEVVGVDKAVSEDGPWCLIDLTGRTVVAGGGFELPDLNGAYEPCEDEQVEGFPVVWLDTPADWLFRETGDDWRTVVAARAESVANEQRVDVRAVLFGRPLLEFLAGRVMDTVDGPRETDDQQWERTRTIHADWLMTARDDLGGRSPRQVLLADRDRIGRDLERRSRQWSMQGHAPPPLSLESVAYRLGGFGTTEVVLYFDLVRSLLGEAWALSMREPKLAKELLIGRLADHRDRWIASPYEDSGDPMTCGELIESERRRMPVTSDGSHLDDDCPICQAEAAGDFGPTFMWFDGHRLELEDEFAFSLTESREEWEREQEECQKFSEQMDRKRTERNASADGDCDDSVWQSSYVDWDRLAGPDATPLLAKSAIGFPLAELVSDLKERPLGRAHLVKINEAYISYQTAQDPVALRSAAEQLRDCLEVVANMFAELTPKSADLQSRLDEVLRRDMC